MASLGWLQGAAIAPPPPAAGGFWMRDPSCREASHVARGLSAITGAHPATQGQLTAAFTPLPCHLTGSQVPGSRMWPSLGPLFYRRPSSSPCRYPGAALGPSQECQSWGLADGTGHWEGRDPAHGPQHGGQGEGP